MKRKKKTTRGRGGRTPGKQDTSRRATATTPDDLLSLLRKMPQPEGEMGRPCLCSHALADRIAEAILEVGYLRPACEKHCLPYSTAKQWMDHGEEALVKYFQGGELGGNDVLYAYFAATVARARSELETTMAKQTKRMALPHAKELKDEDGNELAQGDGHLALSFLKSAFPDRWGQRVLNANVSADVKQKKEVDWSKFSAEEIEMLTQMADKVGE